MTLEYLLKLSAGAFTGPLKQATAGVGGLNQSLGGMKKHNGTVNSLGSSFASLGLKIAAAFSAWKAGEAVFSGFKKSIGLAADAETTAVAFKTLVGSAQLANDVLGKVKKMADTTPFEFPELAGAARMLVAFGEAAKDVPETLRRIGDVSSGVAAPIGEIAEIYGKARTQNQLFAEDINQLTGRGIPIINELAKVLGKPESAIKKLAEEGKITFPLLDQAFRNMTSEGGKFYNMMKEQAGTTNGLLSTLHDGVNDLFKTFGTPLNDAIKPVLTDAIALCEQLKPVVVQLGAHMANAMTAVRNFVTEAEAGSGLAAAMGKALQDAFLEAADVVAAPFRAIGAALPALGTAFMDVLKPSGEWLMAKLESAALNFSSIIMKGIRDALKIMADSSFMASMIPGLKDAANSLNGPAAMAQNDAKLADSHADKIAEGMPKALAEAGKAVDEAARALREKAKNEMQRIGLGLTNEEGKGRSYGEVPGFDNKGMVTEGDAGAPGVKGAVDAATAAKVDKNKAEKDDKQAKARDYEEKELQILKAKAAGNAELATAMEKRLKLLKEADSIQEKTGVGEDKALEQAREKVELQEKLKAMANVPMVPQAVKEARQPAGDDAPHKIHGYSRKQGGKLMGASQLQRRDAAGVTMESLMASLSSRRPGGLSTQTLKLSAPSPGTAKNSQARREAAASAAQAGQHPLSAMLKGVADKLGHLAVA